MKKMEKVKMANNTGGDDVCAVVQVNFFYRPDLTTPCVEGCFFGDGLAQ
jgi:hypothetical protein